MACATWKALTSRPMYNRFCRASAATIGAAPGKPRPWDTAATALQLALARGHRWLAMLESGEAKSLREIAALEGVDNSYVSRMVNLTTLAPDGKRTANTPWHSWRQGVLAVRLRSKSAGRGRIVATKRRIMLQKR